MILIFAFDWVFEEETSSKWQVLRWRTSSKQCYMYWSRKICGPFSQRRVLHPILIHFSSIAYMDCIGGKMTGSRV